MEVRWKKRCVNKNTQSCRQGNSCARARRIFCVTTVKMSQKEAKKRKRGACRRPEPSAAESQSPPWRAAHPPNGVCALSALSPQMASSGSCKKMCVFFPTDTYLEIWEDRDLSPSREQSEHRHNYCVSGFSRRVIAQLSALHGKESLKGLVIPPLFRGHTKTHLS